MCICRLSCLMPHKAYSGAAVLAVACPGRHVPTVDLCTVSGWVGGPSISTNFTVCCRPAVTFSCCHFKRGSCQCTDDDSCIMQCG